MEHKLLFERFLNPERVSLPDIDCDFCKRRRDEVIAYVEEKYGKENVAQLITFGTWKPRVAVRDVGRVLEMPYAERIGRSKLAVVRDGLRFLGVILSAVAYIRVSRLSGPVVALLLEATPVLRDVGVGGFRRADAIAHKSP